MFLLPRNPRMVSLRQETYHSGKLCTLTSAERTNGDIIIGIHYPYIVHKKKRRNSGCQPWHDLSQLTRVTLFPLFLLKLDLEWPSRLPTKAGRPLNARPLLFFLSSLRLLLVLSLMIHSYSSVAFLTFCYRWQRKCAVRVVNCGWRARVLDLLTMEALSAGLESCSA